MTKLLEVTVATAPAAWASALVNGDWSGMSDDDTRACRDWIESQRPYAVADVQRNADGEACDPRFTWHYTLYGGTAAGGEVLDYVMLLRR